MLLYLATVIPDRIRSFVDVIAAIIVVITLDAAYPFTVAAVA